jgi:chromodomain-helicase-DNA-binding protein 1
MRGTNIANIAMELFKIYQHLYLIKTAADPVEQSTETLVESSGKMIMISKLLAKLQADDRRVLIFSHLVGFLGIIAEYLSLVGITFFQPECQP